MRKMTFILAAFLLLAATAAVAEEALEVIAVGEGDTAVGDSLVAEDETPVVVSATPVTRLHIVGNGIAISEDDAFDFMDAKVVVGAVKVGSETEDSNYAVRRLGVLMLDESRYHLKDIAVSEDEISAEIYGPTTDANSASEPVGAIVLKRFEKPGRDVWAGNMVLGENAYNVYFLGVKRSFKLGEITQKIGEYCEETPEDARCRGVLARCGEDPVQCRERAEEYCNNNPTDLGCLQLKKLYCLKNAADERCRQYLKGLCEEYPALAHCRIRTVNGQQVIGINSGAVSSATAEQGETSESLVAEKSRPLLNEVRKNVRDASKAGK